MSATASDIRTGIGARLRAGRERMGMTVLQVAEKLHVDPKVLEFVEVDRFDQLGAPVYARGHIKRYSELLGENTAELLEQYSAMTKPAPPDLTQLPKATRHADPRKLVLPSLVVLIGFALIGTVWWVLETIQSTPSAGPQPVPTTTEGGGVLTEPGDAPTGDAPATTSPAGDAPATVSTPSREPAAPSASPAQAANAGRTASAAPSPAPAPGAAARSSTTPAPSAPPRTALFGNPPPRAGTTAGALSTAQISKASIKRTAAAERARARAVNVTLKFSADSWAEVYDASGQRLFYDIGTASSSHALSGTPPLRVVLGNAKSVSLNINGRAATVPASVMQDSGAQFSINRSGRIVRARPDGG